MNEIDKQIAQLVATMRREEAANARHRTIAILRAHLGRYRAAANQIENARNQAKASGSLEHSTQSAGLLIYHAAADAIAHIIDEVANAAD